MASTPSFVPGADSPALVTAVVVTHDSGRVLAACLAALAREGVCIVVVDNASRDDSRAIARAHGARVLANARNEGFGRAMNRGVRAAGTRWCLLTNPDLVYEPGAIQALLDAARRWPVAGLFAPRLVDADGATHWVGRSLLAPRPPALGTDENLPEGDCCAPFLLGAALLVERDRFLSLGGFDPDLFLYAEDDDLCWRFWRARQPPVHVHGAVARHAGGGSTTSRFGTAYRLGWHARWSRCHVSRTWGRDDPAVGYLLRGLLTCLRTAFTLQGPALLRAAGGVAGALAWLMGRTALAREGLEPLPHNNGPVEQKQPGA